MKLRTQILVFLFLFAFAPLFIAFAINLPLVLERFEHFYHAAHTQNLRADFRDLDQHLASRHQLVSLLARLPSPGNLTSPAATGSPDNSNQAPRTSTIQNNESLPIQQYVSWINRIMATQRDIVLLAFLDSNNKPTHSFIRNANDGNWQLTPQLPVQLNPPAEIRNRPPGAPSVMISPIIIRKELRQQDPRLFMTLNISSPVYPAEGTAPAGKIIMTIDVTDFARHYQNTIWVQSNGQYLFNDSNQSHHSSAFEDYSGLDKLFAQDQLVLWEGQDSKQVIWVPMLRTANGKPLWVGRHVDPSPISEIKLAISWRVIAIMLVLVILIFYLARKFAHRAEKFDQELTDSISMILEEDQPVNIQWQGPVEIQELAEKLSRLSEVHAKNTQRALNHARELESSNRYKSEFLANVSHELRTPLNSILLLSKLIREDDSNSKDQRDKAAVINKAGNDLKSLIDNILDLSRIEAGKTSFSVQEINIRELLEELIILLKPQFEDKQLSLLLSIDSNLPDTIINDAEKLRQILKNFLSNALKFTEQGNVTIYANLQRNNTITISVEDHGIGIDEEKQAHIFGAFQQADGSINRRHGGTGLGLTISTQLAELMGGSISLTSAPGQGSCFSLHLPITFDTHHLDESLVDIESDGDLQSPVTDFHETQEAISNEQHHILIIDNDLNTLLSLTPLLEKWGYRVSGAGDIEEALETLESEPNINLILLDTSAPDTDHLVTADQLNHSHLSIDIPIIRMINDKNEDISDTIICKPVNADKLKTIIERLLAR